MRCFGTKNVGTEIMRGETGHSGDGARVFSGHPAPADDSGVVTVERFADFQGAACAADDLACVHVGYVGQSHNASQAKMWGKPARMLGISHKINL